MLRLVHKTKANLVLHTRNTSKMKRSRDVEMERMGSKLQGKCRSTERSKRAAINNNR